MQLFRALPITIGLSFVLLTGVANATSTTCSTSVVCAEYINTYTSSSPVSGGVAIHGEANGGIGVRGTSVSNVGFYGASGSGAMLSPGVEGESTYSNAGAGGGFGLEYLANKTAPYIGAIGIGSSYGLFGESGAPGQLSSYAYGVVGADNNGSPSKSGDYNVGVFGSSVYGTAILASTGVTPSEGVYSTAPIGVYSVARKESGTPADTSYAFFGESDQVGLQLDDTSNGDETQAMNGGYFLDGLNSKGSFVFFVGDNGNGLLGGMLETAKGSYVRATGSSGAAVREYTDRTTMPQVEDVGDGQLVNGRAYVPIDAHLADTIDRRMEYHVFVTPEGDCNGLFVTQKSPSGFAVRELRGGRSSLAFEYRIVAKPVDESGTRLPALAPQTLPQNATVGRIEKKERIAPPLSIEDELKRRLGPQGYAKALTTLRARLAGR